jgi:hypothetical protein
MVRLEEQEPHSQKCSTRFCALEVSFKGAAMSFFKGVATSFFIGTATSSFKDGCFKDWREPDGCALDVCESDGCTPDGCEPAGREADDCEPGEDGLDSIMNILPSRR